MALWKLTPLNAADPNWEASTYREEVVVRASDGRVARLLAARAFGIATRHRPGEAIKIVPWDYSGLVSSEQVGPTDEYPEEGAQGIVFPIEAVNSAHPGYTRGLGTLLHRDELDDYSASVKKHKFQESDFELDEGEIAGPPDGTVGPMVGTVTITFKPTGISRQYATGHGSSWPYMFETDLARGAFVK